MTLTPASGPGAPAAGATPPAPLLTLPSPDGRWLAQLVRDGLEPVALWIAPAGGGPGWQVEAQALSQEAARPVWTARGTLLFYRSPDDAWLEADPATRQVAPFAPDLLAGRQAGALVPAPDGRRFLVTTGLCHGCNKPSEITRTTYVVGLDGRWQEVGVDVDARWEGDRVRAQAQAPRLGYSGVLFPERDGEGVALVPRPLHLAVQVGAAEAAEWRVYRPDSGPGDPPLAIFPAVNRQDAYSFWELSWPDPPAQPVRLELWAEVRPGVPDSPAFRREGGRRWAVVLSERVRARDPAPAQQMMMLAAARFWNERDGWGLDWAGRVLRTGDGGTTWQDVPPGLGRCAGRLRSRLTWQPGPGWAALAIACDRTGPDGTWSSESGRVTLLVTADGGATWQEAAVDTGYDFARPEAVSLLDGQNGWAVLKPAFPVHADRGALYRTRDGGRTWEKVADTDTGLPAAHGVRFVTPDRGWALGPGRRSLWATADGGRTWQEVVLDLSPLGPQGPAWFHLPTFVSPAEGFVAAQGYPAAHPMGLQVLLSTRDGGRTWEARPWEVNSAGMAGVHFLDEQRGFAVKGHLWVTADGGRSWRAVYPR